MKKTQTDEALAEAKVYLYVGIIGLAISVVSFFFTFFGILSMVSGIMCTVAFFEIKRLRGKGKIIALLGIVISVITFILGMISLFGLAANM